MRSDTDEGEAELVSFEVEVVVPFKCCAVLLTFSAGDEASGVPEKTVDVPKDEVDCGEGEDVMDVGGVEGETEDELSEGVALAAREAIERGGVKGIAVKKGTTHVVTIGRYHHLE